MKPEANVFDPLRQLLELAIADIEQGRSYRLDEALSARRLLHNAGLYLSRQAHVTGTVFLIPNRHPQIF